MALLALLVAGYAIAITLAAGIRPPLVRDLMATWPVAATAHFLGGAVALITGAFQVNSRLRARYLAWHRISGRVYVLAVGVGGIAGFALALDSFAGPVARVGFGLLAVSWLVTTAMAYVRIRQRDITSHRAWMIRSYALTLAAVTLRIYLPASLMSGIDFRVAYPAIAWLCWVPNLVVAEWLIRTMVRQDGSWRTIRGDAAR